MNFELLNKDFGFDTMLDFMLELKMREKRKKAETRQN